MHIWLNGFQYINLAPRSQISFKEWCKKMWLQLMAGNTFDFGEELDDFVFFPGLWHAEAVMIVDH